MKFNNPWLSCATLWGMLLCAPSALHAQTSLLLRTGAEPGALAVQQGQTFDIELQTADLAASGTGNAVGVQALIGFDDAALELIDITENSSDNWTLVSEIVSGGEITYAAGIALGGSISTDGVVATLQFRALAPGTTSVTFRPDRGVSTRITYDDASFVLPTTVPSGDIDIPLCAVDADCDDGDDCTADTCGGVNAAALSFDGSDDHVNLGNNSTITDFGTGSFTVEGWFYLNSAPSTWEGVFRHGRQGAFAQVAVQFNGGLLTVSVESTGAGQVDTPGQAFTLNAWHHFAAVIDRGANQVLLYLDGGTPATAPSAWGANPISSSDDVVLGMARDASGTLFAPLDGLIDEIRIWDHARTQAEILANKDIELTSAAGLLARYGLNEGAGSTTTDSVGALVGNLTNGPAWEAGNLPDLGVGICDFAPIPDCCAVDGDCPDDGNACTDEQCLANACASTYNPTPGCCVVDGDCDDGVVCTVDTCGVGGTCDNTVDPQCCTTDGDCDDSNPCTADACDPGNVSALSFDGSNDHVTMGAATGLNAATFTLETWFQWNSGGSTASTGTGGVSAYPLITKGRGQSEDPTLNCAYFLGILPSGELTADFEEHGTGTTVGLNHPVTGTTALSPDDGQWHHAAVTYDGNCWQLYLDGVADTPGTNCPAEPPDFDSIQHFGLGTAFTSTGAAQGRLSGRLDEVRVWDHARSAGEILADMNSQIFSAPGLIGRWGLNESSGSNASDSTTPAENGTIVGATYVTSDLVNIGTPNVCINDDLPAGTSCTDGDACNGVEVCDGTGTCQAGMNYDCDDGNPCTVDSCMSMNNAALLFDGIDDYVTMGPAPTLNTATFTVEAWVLWAGGGATANTGGGGFLAYPMVTKGVGESETDGLNLNYFLGIVPAAGNVLGGDFEQDAGGGSATGQNFPVLGTTPVSTGQWHHVAMTYDGNCWELYLDGVADTDGTTCPGEDPDFDTAQHFGLGTALSSSGAPSGAFDGLIDEVRVWNYARSAPEIAEGLQRKIESATGLIGRWGLEEGALLVAADSTPNANDGTLTNGVIWQTVDLVDMVVCTHDAVAANGLPCDDGAFCTTGESCSAGVCGGGSATDCSGAGDQCNTGVCNETADACEPQPANEDDLCDDGLFCTTGETCTAGACDGGTPTDCSAAGNQCNDGVCNEGTDACEPQPANEDDPCDDGLFCTTGETCTAGACDGGAPTDCSTEGDQCNDGVCNEVADACEAQPANEGALCDDSLFCTTGETCSGGTCGGGSPTDCSAESDQCNMGVCNEAADACEPQPDNEGAGCDDGLFCTTGETCTLGTCDGGSPTDCSGAGDDCNTGVCNDTTDACEPQPANEGAPCDDTLFCTTGETCASGTCGGGAPTDCSATGDQCNTGVCNDTTDACEPQPANEGAGCDDGLFCTTGETCMSGACAGGAPLDCSAAGDQCNDGVCNEVADACEAQPANEGGPCDDGNACSTIDICGSGLCLGTTPLVCDDMNDCTDDTCDPGTGCVFTIDDTNTCSDDDACTQTDTCDAGVCTGSDPVVCDDGNACTDDSCDPVDGLCDFVNDDTNACSDDDQCTQTDTCQSGTCVGGDPVVCDDGNECTDDSCDPADGTCDFVNDDSNACSDGNLCTNPDACQSGVCVGTPIICDDLNDCTDDSCDPADGLCDFVNNDGNACTDNDACTADVCNGGVCESTVDVNCDDLNECTIDSCDPLSGTCTNDAAAADGNACDDSDACTQTDTCAGGSCVGSNPVDCDDANACTADSCDPGDGSCINDGAPLAGVGCDDGNACTESDSCDGGGNCVGTPIVGCVQCTIDDDCDDGNPCTEDVCNVDTCDFSTPAPDTTPCDDGAFCTVNDECTAGVCGGAARDCSAEDDQCNVGVCNEGLDQCEPQPTNEGLTCDDGLFCTTGETCNTGACGGGAPTDCTAFDDQCNTGTCNEALDQCEAVADNEGLGCDDTLFCTVADTCQAGACVGGARDCSAFDDQCNVGVCNDTADQCEAQPTNEGLACDDGLFCNDGETCQSGACTGGGPTDCEDGDPCTANVCDEGLDACLATNLVEVDVNLEIEGLGNAVTRDVTFILADCALVTDVRTMPVAFDAAGTAFVTLTDVDPGVVSISATEGHTLRRVLPLSFSGCVATADFSGVDLLLAGDFATAVVPKDNFVDISDFAIVSANWLEGVDDCDGMPAVPDPECALGADATGDGLQNLADFSAVLVNFFEVGDAEDLCPEPIGGDGPRTWLRLDELELSSAIRADLNRDNIIDARDMGEFARRYNLRLTREEAHKLQQLEEDAEYEALERKGQLQKSR